MSVTSPDPFEKHIDEIIANFKPSGTPFEVTLDERRRVTLGHQLRKPYSRYRVYDQPDGTIFLIPLVSVPAQLYEDFVEQPPEV